MRFKYMVLLLMLAMRMTASHENEHTAGIGDEFNAEEKSLQTKEGKHRQNDELDSEAKTWPKKSEQKYEKENDRVGNKAKEITFNDLDDKIKSTKAKPIPKMTAKYLETKKEGLKMTDSIGGKKKEVKDDTEKKGEEVEFQSEDEGKIQAIKSDIVNESELRKPTESWLIRVTSGKGNAMKKNKNGPTMSGSKKFLTAQITKPTKQSLKPTTIHETFATTVSNNATRTPSKKPTLEAASTPLPQNETEFSGSGSRGFTEEQWNIAINGSNKNELLKKGENLKPVVSSVNHTNSVQTVTDDEEQNDNESGDKEDSGSERDEVEKQEGDANEDEEKRILCVGDSITEGYYKGGTAFHPYTKKLTELLNAEKNHVTYSVYNEGKSGECVNPGMTERMPSLMQKYKPLKLVLIIGGTNDFHKRKCSDGDLFTSIKKLHEIAHEAGSKTVAVTIPDSNAPQIPGRKEKEHVWESVNDKIREYAKGKENVILCDLAEELPYRTLTDDERKKYWDDDLHYNPAGYDRMAEIIYDVIQGNF